MYPLKILFWYPRKLPEKEGDLQGWTQGGAETEQWGIALSVGITAGAAWGRSEVYSSQGAPTRCSGAQFPPSRPRRRCPLLPPTSSAPSPCPSPFPMYLRKEYDEFIYTREGYRGFIRALQRQGCQREYNLNRIKVKSEFQINNE